jgi:4-alpha-glucanotransferase
MRLTRGSGVLLHPTSLPGRFGIGDLGPSLDEFLQFLTETGQGWWQILPLGPTGYGNSPYQSHCSHAGNRLLISPVRLRDDGLLTTPELTAFPGLPDERVDFDAVAEAKDRLLAQTFRRFDADDPGFERFQSSNAAWLDDYALYMALKAEHGGRSWNDWPTSLTRRQPRALAAARKRLAEEVRFVQFVQYQFDRQWRRVRAECVRRGIGIIGDLPIFVAQDSSDVWARPELFQLDQAGRPTVVAGVPPDYFSETGQLWGNPLYHWPAHEAEGFAWWADRLRATLSRVDLVRLDHFRGFEAYWEVPASAPTAAGGRWVAGPGAGFLQALHDALGGLPLIAEDLGQITPEVEALRDRFNLPGMKILQFAFGNDPMAGKYLPYSYPNHCIVYTGTHDNDTTRGWFTSDDPASTQTAAEIAEEREFVRRYVGTDGRAIHWDLIRLALSSVADTAIVPLQDILGRGSEARMNTPGVASGNWAWRFRADELDPEVRQRLAELTPLYARWRGLADPGLRPPVRKPVEALDVDRQ